MPRYLFQGRYSREGAQGLAREGGTRRRAAVEALMERLGGRLEAFYYAFGETDLFMIVELPDNAAAASASLVVAASGAGHWRTTVLLTAEEMDRAAARGVEYRAPGA
ncbi:MAG TPA: GYD domain-containing protein [Candidatus Tectomicrobia bacterium]|nr:GYD domain-containing protein [Candidatus Tectomicrobia bacterium]